jgi:hypothetical protein
MLCQRVKAAASAKIRLSQIQCYLFEIALQPLVRFFRGPEVFARGASLNLL